MAGEHGWLRRGNRNRTVTFALSHRRGIAVDSPRRGRRYAASVTVVVMCPPAPWLIPGVATALPTAVTVVRAHCLDAIGPLAAMEGITVVTAAGRSPQIGRLLPGTVLDDPGFTRSDVPAVPTARLPIGGGVDGSGPPSGHDVPQRHTAAAYGTVIAAHLLAAARIDVTTHAVQLAVDGPAAVPTPGPRAGMLVLADGASSHGEHAPGGDDPRADTFDSALTGALRGGSPTELADTCRRLAPLATAVRATTLPVWAALADSCAPLGDAEATVLYAGAPLGVGYQIAVWRWQRR